MILAAVKDPKGNVEIDHEILSSESIGTLLGVSRRQVNRWTQDGVIPVLWGGGKALYLPSEVRSALEDAGWSGNQKAKRIAERGTGLHRCSKCGISLPHDRFPPSTFRVGGGWCKDCRRPGKRAADARRRSQKRTTKIEYVDVRIVADRDGNRCGICRKLVKRADWSMDHVIPLSKGGPHTYANVVLAHLACNVRRGVDRAPVQAPLFAVLR